MYEYSEALCYQPHRSNTPIQDSYFEIIRDIFLSLSLTLILLAVWTLHDGFSFCLDWIAFLYILNIQANTLYTIVTSHRIDDFGQQQQQLTIVRYKLN